MNNSFGSRHRLKCVCVSSYIYSFIIILQIQKVKLILIQFWAHNYFTQHCSHVCQSETQTAKSRILGTVMMPGRTLHVESQHGQMPKGQKTTGRHVLICSSKSGIALLLQNTSKLTPNYVPVSLNRINVAREQAELSYATVALSGCSSGFIKHS